MQDKLITVIGNVGSGKSTVCELLAKKLHAKLIPADEFYKTNPFFPLALQDRKRWSLASDLWFLKERVKLLSKLNSGLNDKNIIIDSGIVMSYVYAHSRIKSGYFTDEEWSLYQEIYTFLTKNISNQGIIIYLKAPVNFLLKRIKERGREFEIKNHSKDYLTSLQSSLDFVVKNSNVKVITINIYEKTSINNLVKQI